MGMDGCARAAREPLRLWLKLPWFQWRVRGVVVQLHVAFLGQPSLFHGPHDLHDIFISEHVADLV